MGFIIGGISFVAFAILFSVILVAATRQSEKEDQDD